MNYQQYEVWNDDRSRRRREKRAKVERGPISRLSQGHSNARTAGGKCWTQKNGSLTRKKKYYRRIDAADGMNRFTQSRGLDPDLFRVYSCPHCGGFHWGRRKVTSNGQLIYEDA